MRLLLNSRRQDDRAISSINRGRSTIRRYTKLLESPGRPDRYK